MPDIFAQRRKGTVLNTTAATANQVALEIPTTSDTAVLIKATVTAVSTDNFDEAQAYGVVGLFLNDGGTLAQVGSTGALFTAIESVGGRDVNFNVSGTDIQLRVVPADATPLTWLCDVEIKEVTDYNANSGWIH